MGNKMYVFFNEDGDIMSVSPQSTTDLENMQSAELPRQQAIDFLSGTKNMYRYAIVADKETGNFKCVSKETEPSQLSTVGRYLTEVTYEFHDKHDIMIEHDVRRKKLRITMSATGISKADTKRNKTLISNHRKLSFYFTLFGDPNMLICGFDVNVKELVDGDVFVSFEHLDSELNNATLFTKQILSKYHYRKLQYT